MQDLGETEVDDLDEALGVYHHVLRLDVPINDIVALHGLYRAKDLRGVKLDPPPFFVLCQLHVILILQHPVKSLAGKKLKNEVDAIGVRKGLFETDNVVQWKRMLLIRQGIR